MAFVMAQISTNVLQTTEAVSLKLTALTRRATSCALVHLDTLEMDLPAQVNRKRLVTSSQKAK